MTRTAGCAASRVVFALAVLWCIAIARPAEAQSLYACRSLNSAIPPSFEGNDGVLFRVEPDLLSYQRLSDDVVAAVAGLSRSLAKQGVALIFVPLPTKALTVPHRLGPEAVRRAYDPDLTATLFDDTIRRLEAAGVNTIPTRRVLFSRHKDAMSYFVADPRLSPKGLQRLARAVADKLPKIAAPPQPLETTHVPPADIASLDRVRLQSRCLLPLPAVKDGGRRGLRLNGQEFDPMTAPRAPVAIVGTRLTGTRVLDFAGILSDTIGHPVLHRSDAGEDPWTAITSYLLSPEFQASRPEVLIWEVPIWSNPGVMGRRPFRALNAALTNDCGPTAKARSTGTGSSVVALNGLRSAGQDTLRLRFGDPVTQVRVTFETAEGAREIRIVRQPGLETGARDIYVPLTEVLASTAQSAEIVTTPPSQSPPSAALCRE